MTRITHGLSKTRLYGILRNMKQRCYNPKNPRYNFYGEIGIKICDEWLNDFKTFYEWAMNNGYRDDLTIERKDVNGNYCPENCCWITNKEQQFNKHVNHFIEFNGKRQTMTEWGEELGIDPNTIGTRLSRGWNIERALTTPVIPKKIRNDLTLNGETKRLCEWAELYDIKVRTLTSRLDKGMGLYDALTTPIKVSDKNENNIK